MALKLTITTKIKPKKFLDLGNTKAIYYKLEFKLIKLTNQLLVFYGATTFEIVDILVGGEDHFID